MKESHRESISWTMKDIHKGAGQARGTACAKSQWQYLGNNYYISAYNSNYHLI